MDFFSILLAQSEKPVTCQTIMLPNPVTVLESASLTNSIDLLFQHHIKILPVVDANGIYRGLFGIHSLVRHLLPRAATLDGDARIGDLAFVHDTLETLKERLASRLGESIICFADTALRPLAPDMSLVETLLHLHRHRHNLPVVDLHTGRLLGLVTYWGILAKLTDRPA
jgi:CBS-domain-containing membrane protein